MNLECPVLQSGRLIPNRFAFRGVPGGQNLSLPLRWSGCPEGTRSYLLTIIDRHPVANNWVHWLLVNIPSTCTQLSEGVSSRDQLPEGSVQLRNSFGELGYGGPKPPRGSGPHEYVVTLHALSVAQLSVSEGMAYAELMRMVEQDVLATARVVGVFEQ